VEEIAPANRPDFTLREEAGHRNPSHPFLKYMAIMMGLPKQAFSPTATTKQESAEGLAPVFGTI
jgi:hypothetical protein